MISKMLCLALLGFALVQVNLASRSFNEFLNTSDGGFQLLREHFGQTVNNAQNQGKSVLKTIRAGASYIGDNKLDQADQLVNATADITNTVTKAVAENAGAVVQLENTVIRHVGKSGKALVGLGSTITQGSIGTVGRVSDGIGRTVTEGIEGSNKVAGEISGLTQQTADSLGNIGSNLTKVAFNAASGGVGTVGNLVAQGDRIVNKGSETVDEFLQGALNRVNKVANKTADLTVKVGNKVTNWLSSVGQSRPGPVSPDARTELSASYEVSRPTAPRTAAPDAQHQGELDAEHAAQQEYRNQILSQLTL